MSIKIPVVELEFHEGQDTIWVHGPKGATVLRIQCAGKIVTHKDSKNVCPFIDLLVNGNIDIMMPAKKKRVLDGAKRKK